MNIAARYRRKYGVQDLEDANLWDNFQNNIDCSCSSCSTISVTRIDERDERYNRMTGAQQNESGNAAENPPVRTSDDEADATIVHSDAVHVEGIAQVDASQ